MLNRILQLALHRMKNMGFGRANDKIRLRVVFPGTYDRNAGRTQSFPDEQMKKDFLEYVLRPAVLRIHQKSSVHWPLSYRQRKWAAQRASGRFAYPMKGIKHSKTRLLVSTMHRILRSEVRRPRLTERLLPMVGFVIAWEIQDIKLFTAFEPTLGAPQDHPDSYMTGLQNAIQFAFSDTDLEALNQENTHVDLAVEMSVPGQSLYFRHDGHALILEHILGYTRQAAERLVASTSSGARYQNDSFVGLEAIAGFHLKLKGEASPYGYLYAQAYHTEKEIAYQAASKNKIVPLDALAVLNPQWSQGTRGYLFWTECALSALLEQMEQGVGNSARFEVTVSLSSLIHTDINFSDELIRLCLVALDLDAIPWVPSIGSTAKRLTEFYRAFRYMKLRSCFDLAFSTSLQSPAIRASPPVVGLAACLWRIALSMFGRPLQTEAGRWIAESGHLGPNIHDDSMTMHGQYLLTNIDLDPDTYPRLLIADEPGSRILKELFGVTTLRQLQEKLRSRRRAGLAVDRGRLPTQSTARPGDQLLEPLDNIRSRCARVLERQGVRIMASAGHSGEVEEVTGDEGGAREHGQGLLIADTGLMVGWPIDCRVEGIFSMYTRTFWQKVPNQRLCGSWLASPTIVHDAYNAYGQDEWRLPLGQIQAKFRAVETTHSSIQWNRIFNHLFPTREGEGGRNLSSQDCRKEWMGLMSVLESEGRLAVLGLMRAKFDTLTAAPDVKHDKWFTSSAARGPMIIVNPNKQSCDRRSGYLDLAELVGM